MLDSLETYWLRVLAEVDGGGGLPGKTGQEGKMVYEPGIADRRQFRRYTYEVVVECTILDPVEGPGTENRFPALTQNVSRLGLAILSNAPIVPDQAIGIQNTHKEKAVERYRVRWVRKTNQGTYLSGLIRDSG